MLLTPKVIDTILAVESGCPAADDSARIAFSNQIEKWIVSAVLKSEEYSQKSLNDANSDTSRMRKKQKSGVSSGGAAFVTVSDVRSAILDCS